MHAADNPDEKREDRRFNHPHHQRVTIGRNLVHFGDILTGAGANQSQRQYCPAQQPHHIGDKVSTGIAMTSAIMRGTTSKLVRVDADGGERIGFLAHFPSRRFPR